MRIIDTLVVHCSATPAGLPIGAKEINSMHIQRGFAMIGYHFVIKENGNVEKGRDIEKIGAHVSGHNAQSIGICLVGGLDAERKPANTFTPAQFAALDALLRKLRHQFPAAKICGHRDLSPDKDGDGKVERHEWVKECPCFDVASWCLSRSPSIIPAALV